MLTKRTQILFDEKLWKRLVILAKKHNTSIGELTRKAIKQTYFSKNVVDQRKAAFEHILKIRRISKTPVDYKELINAGRKH